MTGIQKQVTDEQRAAFLPLTPIGRFAQPEEVAATIVFLCSEGSSFITAPTMLAKAATIMKPSRAMLSMPA